MTASLLWGSALGLVLGAMRGAAILAFYGFWGGLAWVLLLGGIFGFWFSSRRLRATRAAVSFSAGVVVGVAPWGYYYSSTQRDLNLSELWFPISLAFLLGLALSPGFIALFRRLPSPDGR